MEVANGVSPNAPLQRHCDLKDDGRSIEDVHAERTMGSADSVTEEREHEPRDG